MSLIRGKDTRPELTLRSLLHSAGFRFRVHVADLPGKPDLVLKKHGVAILVHGCFWHRHKDCSIATSPKSNPEFWQEKFAKNVIRDKRNLKALKKLGWRVFIVWECQLKTPTAARATTMRLARRMTPPSALPKSVV
jgi:DNA mismatch endonuclease (patch repair protein)